MRRALATVHVAFARVRAGQAPIDRRDRGATAVEYGLIIALIAIVIIVAVLLLGQNLSGSFGKSASRISSAAG